MAKNQQKIGLALSGGFTYGIAHIGVIAALEEAKIPVDYISGTSAGSFVGAYLAFGFNSKQMFELTSGLNWKKISKFTFSRMGLKNNEPMATFLADTLGDVQIEDAKIPLAIVATNIETHKTVTITKGPVNVAVRASTSIPGLFTPVEVDGQLLVDGGLTQNVPIAPLTDMGATCVIAVNLLNATAYSRPKNVVDVLSKSVDILSLHRDQHIAHQANVLIEPDLSTFDSMSFKSSRELFEAGYAAGKAAIPKIKEALVPKQRSPFSNALSKLFSLFSN